MFNFDFEKLLKWVIPYDLVRPRFEAFMAGLMSHIRSVYVSFLMFVSDTEKKLRITPQKRILQYELNLEFDAALMRIEILDAELGSILWIFIESENNPVYLPQFISGTGYDFLVRVPAELEIKEAFIRAFLNSYKLAGKRYQIEYF